jgi:two-component system sensor histidine kinase GlrK
MKVATKITLGYSTLVLLLVGGIGYEFLLIQRMQEINTRLSEVNVRSVERATRLGENLRDVEEFAEKYLVLGDPDYGAQFDSSRGAFARSLGAMIEIAGSEAERGALGQLDAIWEEFLRSLGDIEASRQPGIRAGLPARIEDQIRRMHVQVDAIVREVRRTVDSEVRLAAAASRQAQRVSWVVGVAAASLAGGIALSMARSIGGSFRRFMGATASIAAGEFDGRLPEDRQDEFGELARSFNTMAARLKELDRLKKDFVSSVSHELKSPIASSREIVQLLLDEVPGPVNDEQRRLLELSIRSSRRLSAMVGGLLDLVRMDAGTMRYDMESRDLRALVSAALEEFEVVAKDRDLRIEAGLDEVAPVCCDADRIVQVVGNLVDNAMKFSRRGSLISIRLENVSDGSEPQLKSGVMLSIIDDGPGVPDAHKRRVFARFQQVKAEGSRQQGVGLGLAICRSIVEDHGGRIWVEDNPRGGAVFRFVLPSVGVESRNPNRSPAVEV